MARGLDTRRNQGKRKDRIKCCTPRLPRQFSSVHVEGPARSCEHTCLPVRCSHLASMAPRGGRPTKRAKGPTDGAAGSTEGVTDGAASCQGATDDTAGCTVCVGATSASSSSSNNTKEAVSNVPASWILGGDVLDEMAADLLRSLTDKGRKLQLPSKVSVATMCSGSEVVSLAWKAIQRAFHEQLHHTLEVEHKFICEADPKKLKWGMQVVGDDKCCAFTDITKLHLGKCRCERHDRERPPEW